jgi:hypothetical protein
MVNLTQWASLTLATFEASAIRVGRHFGDTQYRIRVPNVKASICCIVDMHVQRIQLDIYTVRFKAKDKPT